MCLSSALAPFKIGPCPGIQISAFIFLTSEIDKEDSQKFIKSLCIGSDLNVDSPIFSLRQRLMDDKMSIHALPQMEKLALIIKAWNFFRQGKTVRRRITWNKEKEKFPVMK